MAECRLRRPDGTVNKHSFTQGPCTFGRGGAANLRIDDEFMSRVHCEVFLRENEVVIRDMNSRNGTIVNGQRTQEQVLKTGDKILLGETHLTFLTEAEMVPSQVAGEPPSHKVHASFRIVPKEPPKLSPSSTVLIPLPQPAPKT